MNIMLLIVCVASFAIAQVATGVVVLVTGPRLVVHPL
jgi:hypothetical protein